MLKVYSNFNYDIIVFIKVTSKSDDGLCVIQIQKKKRKKNTCWICLLNYALVHDEKFKYFLRNILFHRKESPYI